MDGKPAEVFSDLFVVLRKKSFASTAAARTDQSKPAEEIQLTVWSTMERLEKRHEFINCALIFIKFRSWMTYRGHHGVSGAQMVELGAMRGGLVQSWAPLSCHKRAHAQSTTPTGGWAAFTRGLSPPADFRWPESEKFAHLWNLIDRPSSAPRAQHKKLQTRSPRPAFVLSVGS